MKSWRCAKSRRNLPLCLCYVSLCTADICSSKKKDIGRCIFWTSLRMYFLWHLPNLAPSEVGRNFVFNLVVKLIFIALTHLTLDAVFIHAHGSTHKPLHGVQRIIPCPADQQSASNVIGRVQQYDARTLLHVCAAPSRGLRLRSIANSCLGTSKNEWCAMNIPSSKHRISLFNVRGRTSTINTYSNIDVPVI